MPQAQEHSAGAAETIELNEFDKLLDKSFKPKTDEAKGAVRSAVAVLAAEALKGAPAAAIISKNKPPPSASASNQRHNTGPS